ncbi:MAG: hypothetical protein ACP5M4_07025 [Acidobacteriaceae bacterium]
MAEVTEHCCGCTACDVPKGGSRGMWAVWLQGVTIAWMVVECGVSLWSAVRAGSPALLAFGSDSFVELLSAGVVLLRFAPRWGLSEARAALVAVPVIVVEARRAMRGESCGCC